MTYSDNEDNIIMGAEDGHILMTEPYDENTQLIDMNTEDICSRSRRNMISNYRDGAQEYNKYHNNNTMTDKIIKKYNNETKQPGIENILEEGQYITYRRIIFLCEKH